MFRLSLGLCALVFVVTQTGCVSMSSLQTAETLKKGQKQQTFGGGTYNSEEVVDNNTVKKDVPYLEYSYREGLSDNVDAGLKLTIIGSAAADVKYRLIDGDAFDFSVGAGVGYFNLKTGSGETEVENTSIDLMVPIYASYRFNESWAAYLTPRYVHRMTSYSGAASGSTSASLGGGAAGVKIGNTWGVYLEAAYQKALDGDFDLMQYNVSLFWEEAGGVLSSMF